MGRAWITRAFSVAICALLLLTPRLSDADSPRGLRAKAGKKAKGVLVVRLNPDKSFGTLKETVENYGLELETAPIIPELQMYRVKVPPGLLNQDRDDDEENFARALKSDHRRAVQFAEPDTMKEPALNPNDPQFTSQWHLPKIFAPEAWGLNANATGLNSIKIAIIDTGVNPHPDLVGTNPPTTSKLVPGWSVYDNSSNTEDIYGHGTAVAGAAAALTNNGVGVSGVAWGPKIMPIKISGSLGYSYASTIAQGLVWAANNGARVANISFSNLANDPIVDSGIYYFMLQGGVVVASAGVGWGVSASDDPLLLSVNATDQNDVLAEFCFPGTYADVAAPGVDILTTAPLGGYQPFSGLSLSSPIVAGVAALVMSVNPSLPPLRVIQTIKQSATDKGPPGYDLDFGAGLVNAQAAVSLAIAGGAPSSGDTTLPTVNITSPTASQSVSGLVTVRVTANDNVGLSSLSFAIDGKIIWVDTIAPFDTFLWPTTTVTNGSHTIRVEAVDRSFNRQFHQVTVNVNNPTDTKGPSMQIHCPRNNLNPFSGIRQVVVGASDESAVATVSLSVDGGPTIASAPADNLAGTVLSWNTSSLSNSTHTLTATATDIWGNSSATSVPVTIRNVGGDTTAPPPAILVSPLFEQMTNHTPTFTWQMTNDPSGVTYRLLVARSDDHQFLTPVISATMNTTTYTLPSPLADGDYIWTVDTIDGAGNVQACENLIGVISILPTDTVAPLVPILLNPTNGSSITNIVRWSWSAVTDPGQVRYELQVDNNGATFPSPELSVGNLESPSYTSYFALPVGTYTWRVRARDGASPPNYSNWTNPRTVNITASTDTTAPAIPTLVSPANPSSTADATPLFDWQDISDPSGINYQIQLDDNGSGFPSPEIDEVVAAVSSFTPRLMVAPGTYSWKVRSIDGVGLTSSWSAVRTLTINEDTTPPTVPTLLSPPSNIVSTNTSFVFDWTDSTDVNNVTYEILVTDSFYYQGYYIYEWDLTESQFLPQLQYPGTLFPLPSGGTYVWRARAFDGVNYSDWSTAWLITVASETNSPVNPIVPTITILEPTNGATVSGNVTIRANVTDDRGLAEIKFSIDDEDIFFPPELDNPIEGVWYSYSAPNGPHVLQVRATDSDGNVISSQVNLNLNNSPPPYGPGVGIGCPIPWGGGTLAGTQLIRVESFEFGAPSMFRVMVDGTTVLSRDPASQMFIWNTTTVGDGSHTIRVDEVDFWGNSTYSEVSLPVKNTGSDVTPPASPTRIAPVDSIPITNPRPTFDWSDVSDTSGVTYRLLVDDDPLLKSPIINVSGLTTSSYTPPTNLPDNYGYYWRVDAKDGAGNLSPCGTLGIFSNDNFSGPPPVPSPVAPANGASLPNRVPILDWNDVTDSSGVPIAYLVQIDDSSDFSSLIVETFIDDSFYGVPLSTGTFYWRVRASNGEFSAWSPTRSFTITASSETTPPAAVTLLAPANGGYISQPGTAPGNTIVWFDWADVSDPSGVIYDIEGDNSGGTFPSPEVGNSVSSSKAGHYGLADGTYSWRVRARDGLDNYGPWSSVWTFIIDQTAPAPPALLSPTNGSATTDRTPAFDWADATDVAGIRYYRLEIADANFATVLLRTNLTSSAFTVPSDLPPGLYYWRVGAEDTRGNIGLMSNRFSLRISGDLTPPSPPELISPTNGSYTASTRPTFDWAPVSDPSGVVYRIQVDNNGGNFPSPEINVGSITATSYAPTTALASGNYSWKVMATDGEGRDSVWSEVRTLSVGLTPPVAPEISASDPADGFVDPLSDRSTATGDPLGLTQVSITFSKIVNGFGGVPLTVSNFRVTSFRNGSTAFDLETEAPPEVRLQSGTGAGPYILVFDPRVPVGVWTEIRAVDVYDSSGTEISPEHDRIVIAALPGDTTQDGKVLGDDLTRWLQINQNPGALDKRDYCDQNRNGSVDGNDMARLIQLLNGIETRTTWANYDLGPPPERFP